ncbi:N-acetyltransferase [Geminocystis sp. NIES-3709]|uniref:GNAT family N-acetyltransferase n=1 Tax=Geminocystis sp. NIES-3709 TaxID=1617448 RepID=UPI0005FCB3AE|nr:GNAT family N-acetyltransferase [Geminocystis sp. NIES-3709]BAQ65143.1 histone acetyltransferase HPA2 and related acetyltransferases [Geminocystis sp. NIES-3709]
MNELNIPFNTLPMMINSYYLHNLNITKTEQNHLPLLKKVIDSTGLFPSEYLEGMMEDYFTNSHSDDVWITGIINDSPVGIAYFAPERLTNGTYNLYLIAIAKEFQNLGIGTLMIEYIETFLKQSNNRILIVETSGLSEFQSTRVFYQKRSYFKEAIIRDFYNDGNDKIVFWKKL